jgi:tripartite-type tricarboxylate transporter receptor subunit TctC
MGVSAHTFLTRRAALNLGTAFVLGELVPRRAAAQPRYPERPIKLVIPFGPGGLADVVGRLWADKAKTLLGPVFIENQGGAGGSIGRAAVVRADPDGYTILFGGAIQIVNRIATSHEPYDPAKDLEPISVLVVAALAIVIHPSLPSRNLREFIDYAKTGAKLSYGSAAAGTLAHLTGELFKSLAGTPDIVHVPYKGGGQSIVDLVSGHIPMIATNVTNQVLELHHSGKVRVLAVTSPTRLAAAPDIPTAVEAGLPGMIAQNFIGLFAPPGTPKAILLQISDATGRAMADNEFRQRLIASGFDPYPDSSLNAARRFVDDEINRLTPVIRTIGLKLE